MGNKIITGILFVTSISLLSILVIVFHNYTTTNRCIKKSIEGTEYTIAQTNAIVRDHLDLSEAHKETLRLQESLFNKHLSDIKDLSKGIIDSNVLTFLFSSLLIFFGSLLFYVLTAANENVKKAEKSAIKAKKTAAEAEESVKKAKMLMDKLEAERNLLTLHTLLYTLFVLFANKNYYRLESETQKLLSDFDSGKYLFISEEWKTDFLKMIDEKMLYFLNVDKVISKDWYLQESVKALEKLKEKISGLIEI